MASKKPVSRDRPLEPFEEAQIDTIEKQISPSWAVYLRAHPRAWRALREKLAERALLEGALDGR